MDALKKKINQGATDEDTLVLYAQTLDRYSLFLHHVKRANEAVKILELALEVAESVFGNLENKVGVSNIAYLSYICLIFSCTVFYTQLNAFLQAILLSDMGVLKLSIGNKEEAAQCFDKALAIAKKEDVDTSAAVVMVNRGIALKESGNQEEGKHWCTMAKSLAIKEKNKSILNVAEGCLKANSSNKNEGKTNL